MTDHIPTRALRLAAVVAAPLSLLAGTADVGAASASTFTQTNLVSDQPGVAAKTDPNLVNAWGLVSSATSPWWVSDNGTGLSTLYTGGGAIVPLVVSIPAPAGASANFVPGPSGIVFNGGGSFIVSKGTSSGSAIFIWATEDGTISGWNPGVDRTHAIKAVDNFHNNTGAVYKGLELATNSRGQRELFATNFRAGTVDVFDSAFRQVGSFADPTIPSGFAPFGISLINGDLFVTFAEQNATKDADVPGVSHGFIDVFNTDGHFVNRFARRGVLDSPWGMVVAPSSFGAFGGDLLVGNFGNGRIHAFSLSGGDLGPLLNAQGSPIVIDGLWALRFGNGAAAGPTTTLFFTAGPDNQNHGLLGTLAPAS